MKEVEEELLMLGVKEEGLTGNKMEREGGKIIYFYILARAIDTTHDWELRSTVLFLYYDRPKHSEKIKGNS